MIKSSDVKWIKSISDLKNSIIQYQPYLGQVQTCELDNFYIDGALPEWKRILALHKLETQFKNAIDKFDEDQKNHWVYKHREVFFLYYDLFIDCLDKADENRFYREWLKIDISLHEFKHYTEFSYLYNKKCSDSEFCRHYDEILK